MRRRPRVRVEAPQSGGGQERGMRSGTVPTPLCVGLGEACELAMQEMNVSISNISTPSPSNFIFMIRDLLTLEQSYEMQGKVYVLYI